MTLSKDNQFYRSQKSSPRFAIELFKSVAFLHDLSLVHTDLKPEIYC